MTENLLERARQGDKAAGEQLLQENSGLIWCIARRFFGRGAEPEDLYQLGCLGFVKAMQGYDPEFGTRFSTYAVPKIAGEIRRFLRDDGAVKVSRSIKERALTIRLARDRLGHSLGREPTLSEIAEETGLEPQDIAMCEAATEPVESIQQESGDEGFSLERVLTSGSGEDGIIERLALREAMAGLPDREKQILALRYFRGLTQQSIARILGVSQVQISRTERRALNSLRELLYSEG